MRWAASSIRRGRILAWTATQRWHNSTVNAEEVAKFSRIGAGWWEQGSSAGVGPLHAMNPARVGFIRDSLAKKLGLQGKPVLEQLQGLEILDVGCGGGLLSEALSRLGAKVTAIDPSEENIRVAKQHSLVDPQTSSIEYHCTTVEDLAASGKSFDAVCSLEVLEHVESPLAFVKSCRQCLRPGGSLFLATINRTAKSYAMTILGAEYLLRLLPVGTHDWNKFITPEELIALLAASGGKVTTLDVQGLVLEPSLPPRWALSRTDHDINYITHAHF